MSIAENILELKAKLPGGVQLVAVSKTKPNESIMEAYNGGHLVFGENKPQELARKHLELPKDIQWHFIGHLQTNKVKYIAPFVSLIHAVDSLKLLQIINKEAEKNNRTINYLLQMHIAEESTKFGLSRNKIEELIKQDQFRSLTKVNLVGLMGMATYTKDQDQIRSEFRNLKSLFQDLKISQFSLLLRKEVRWFGSEVLFSVNETIQSKSHSYFQN